MIDCSKTDNFLKEWYRICKSKEVGCEACATCKMWFLNNEQGSCMASVMKDPQRAIDIVQKWSDENSGPLAKWEINSDGYYPYCSDCGFEPEKISLYCPNCGKKMINSLELMEKGKLKE